MEVWPEEDRRIRKPSTALIQAPVVRQPAMRPSCGRWPALRGSMDAAEYKHVVLGLIFLKYISDAFEEGHTILESEREQGADPEDPDEYRAENIFWVPSEARWTHLKAQAKQPTVGQLVDDAMTGRREFLFGKTRQ